MTHSTLLVNASLVLDHERRPLVWQTWRLSPDGKYVLFRADSKQQWRHSSRANYWVYRLSDSTSFPITTLEYPPRTAFASWSPVGHALAFVHSNDLYVIPESAMGDSNPKAVRVTTDGSETVFNGVPDWVYEEECTARTRSYGGRLTGGLWRTSAATRPKSRTTDCNSIIRLGTHLTCTSTQPSLI
jgi:dipeptidyl aminopeptidase